MCSGALVTGAADAAWSAAAQTIKILLQPPPTQQSAMVSSPKQNSSPKRVSTNFISSLSSPLSPLPSARAGGGNGSSSNSLPAVSNYNFAAAAATAAITTTTGYHPYELHDIDHLKQVD